MKKYLLIASLGICVMACGKTDDSLNKGLLGKWKLSEYLADPGDGSGTWQPAIGAQSGSVEFRKDSSLIQTGFSMVNGRSRYLVKDSNTVIFINGTDSTTMTYQLSAHSLTLHPPCIEGCGLRYKKTADAE